MKFSKFQTKSLMVNATEMAKPFGKRPKEWLRLKSTDDFIHAYLSKGQISPLDLIYKVKGGNNSGTWMHQDIALEFARCLFLPL